jgi:hypothetical protein
VGEMRDKISYVHKRLKCSVDESNQNFTNTLFLYLELVTFYGMSFIIWK